MSAPAPIHNVRGGVIPAVVPSAPSKEQRNLARLILNEDESYPAVIETVAQLIADCEARAVEPMRTLAEKMCEQSELLAKANRDLIAEVEQLRIIVKSINERSTALGCTQDEAGNWINARAEKAEAGEASLRAELATERARLDWLLNWNVTGHPYKTRAAIDAAMKETTT